MHGCKLCILVILEVQLVPANHLIPHLSSSSGGVGFPKPKEQSQKRRALKSEDMCNTDSEYTEGKKEKKLEK